MITVESYKMSRSDVGVVLPIIRARLLELEEYAHKLGYDPYEVPYYTHLCAIAYDLERFL